jgi:hypothetical protein
MRNNKCKFFGVIMIIFFIILPIIPASAQETNPTYNHSGWRSVNGNNHRASTVDTNNYNNQYVSHGYAFEWLKVGRNLIQTGTYTYDISDQTTTFNNNQTVYALTKLVNISVSNHFQIKYSLYKDGNFYRDVYGGMNYPTYFWEYNYAWVNFCNLPVGNYEIRPYINIDDS